MTAPKTAEEWGRLAVSLPGWRWMPGMLGLWSDTHGEVYRPRIDGHPGPWVKSATAGIDHDDPATAGCLLALLFPFVTVTRSHSGGYIVHVAGPDGPVFGTGSTLGRACIAAAAALGRWPGGDP